MFTTFKLIFSTIFIYLKPVLLLLLQEVTEEVLELVDDVVETLSHTDLSSSDKRRLAFDSIKERLSAAGKELSNNMIYTLIELAYTRLKGKN